MTRSGFSHARNPSLRSSRSDVPHNIEYRAPYRRFDEASTKTGMRCRVASATTASRKPGAYGCGPARINGRRDRSSRSSMLKRSVHRAIIPDNRTYTVQGRPSFLPHTVSDRVPLDVPGIISVALDDAVGSSGFLKGKLRCTGPDLSPTAMATAWQAIARSARSFSSSASGCAMSWKYRTCPPYSFS